MGLKLIFIGFGGSVVVVPVEPVFGGVVPVVPMVAVPDAPVFGGVVATPLYEVFF
jgi:hypothetical protein